MQAPVHSQARPPGSLLPSSTRSSMSNARLRVLASILLFTAAASSASAEVLVHTVQVAPTAVPWSQQVSLPRFHPNLGMLRFIRVTLSGWVSGTLGLENTDPQMS